MTKEKLLISNLFLCIEVTGYISFGSRKILKIIFLYHSKNKCFVNMKMYQKKKIDISEELINNYEYN